MATQELELFGSIGKKLAEEYLPQLKRNYEAAKKLTEDLNPQRKLNVKFLAGKQWVQWNKNIGAVEKVNPMYDGGKVEPVTDNVLEPLSTQRVSFLASATPSFEAVSVTAEGQDMSDAALADRMFGVFWDKYSLSDFFARGHNVESARYNCFYRSFWDYGAGAIKQVNLPNEEGGETATYRANGDIQIERVNPENVFVDPKAERVMPIRTETNDARWLFYMSPPVDIGWLMKQPWARNRVEPLRRGGEIREVIWGGLPEEAEINAADSLAATEGDKAAAAALGIDTETGAEGASVHTDPDKPGQPSKVVRVLFYYEHPSEDFPHGRYAAFLPDNEWWVLEYREELPHATEEFPDGLFLWVMSKDKEMTGRLAGECRVTQARPLQVELNHVWTSWRTLRKNLKPIVSIDEDATTNANYWLNAGWAKVMTYHSNAGFQGNPEPKVFWPPALQLEATTAQNEAQYITRKIEDKIGIHNPANVPHKQGTTWSEISTILMRDLDALRDGDVIRHESTVYAPFLAGLVKLGQRYLPEDQMLTFFGDKGRPAVIRFKKAQLNFSDVRIVRGTTMRKSKALQTELYMTALKLGLLNDDDPIRQRTIRAQALAAMNLQVSIESSLDVIALQRAQEENLLLLEGKEVPVEWTEPSAIHIQEHWRMRNSPEFYNASEQLKPEIRRVTDEHIMCHSEVARLSQDDISQAVLLSLQEQQQQATQRGGASQQPVGGPAKPQNANYLGAPATEQAPAEQVGQGGVAEQPVQPMPPVSNTP
jgi:hypothetical protein